jgi:hypothetical protein
MLTVKKNMDDAWAMISLEGNNCHLDESEVHGTHQKPLSN